MNDGCAMRRLGGGSGSGGCQVGARGGGDSAAATDAAVRVNYM